MRRSTTSNHNIHILNMLLHRYADVFKDQAEMKANTELKNIRVNLGCLSDYKVFLG